MYWRQGIIIRYMPSYIPLLEKRWPPFGNNIFQGNGCPFRCKATEFKANLQRSSFVRSSLKQLYFVINLIRSCNDSRWSSTQGGYLQIKKDREICKLLYQLTLSRTNNTRYKLAISIRRTRQGSTNALDGIKQSPVVAMEGSFHKIRVLVQTQIFALLICISTRC